MKGIFRFIQNRLQGVHNNRGMALLTTFIVITVLLMLGVGIVVLVQANAKQTQYADATERLYYSAEGGAQQAVEQLKRATANCYNDLGQDRLNSLSTYNTNMTYFFTESSSTYSVIRRAFGSKAASGKYEYQAVGLSFPTLATIEMSDGPDSSSKLFTITSTATSGTTQKQAIATLTIRRKDVTYLQTQEKINPNLVDYLFGDYSIAALLLGGTLDFSNLPNTNYVDLKSVRRPAASLGRLIETGANQLTTSPTGYGGFFNPYNAVEEDYNTSHQTLTLDSLNWFIEYSMLYNDGDDSKESAFKTAYSIVDNISAPNPSAKHSLIDPTGAAMKVPANNIVTPAGLFTKTYDAVTGQLVVDGSGNPVLTAVPNVTIKAADYPNGSSSANRKLYLMGESRPHASSKVSYTMQDFNYNYDKMTDAYIYCDGDLTIQRCMLNKAFIHCTGDLYITNAQLIGSTVYCDGNIYITNDSTSNSYSAWRTILQAFISYITGSGSSYLKDNPNLIYSKYDTVFNGNDLNGYYYVGRDLYANKGDMSVRPASIIYVTRNAYMSANSDSYKYRGLVYSFGNVSVEGPVSIAGQLAARGNLSIARTNSNAKLSIDFGVGNALTSELEDLFGSSSRFNSSNFNTAVYISASSPQVVLPKSSEIFVSESSVKPK